MKFGIFSVVDYYRNGGQPLATRYGQTLDNIKYADQLGFKAFWIGEHHFFLNSSTALACPNPAVILAAAAQITSRIGLNTAVANLSLRHPLQLAEDYAMVDLLSQGRLGFGIGRGAFAHEYQAFGQSQAESSGRFEEAWQIIQQAWRGEPLDFQGRYYQIKNALINVLPIQQPLPRYWMATMNPGSFTARGQAGQPIIAIPYLTATGLADMGRLAGQYNTNYRAAQDGRATDCDLPLIFHTHLAPTRLEAHQVGMAALQRYIAHQHTASNLPGQEVVRHLQARQQLFFGQTSDIIELIDQYQAATNSNYFIFWLDFGGMEAGLVRRSMELLATEVIPHFTPD